MEKHIVKIGLATLDKPMTKKQAIRYGRKHMPEYLKHANFDILIYTASQEINGWTGWRIGYGKVC